MVRPPAVVAAAATTAVMPSTATMMPSTMAALGERWARSHGQDCQAQGRSPDRLHPS
jgi:hypothetical protein